MNYESGEYVDNFIKGGYALDEIMTAYLHVIRFGVTTVWIWINWKRSAAYRALTLSSLYPELIRYPKSDLVVCNILSWCIYSSTRLKLGVSARVQGSMR